MKTKSPAFHKKAGQQSSRNLSNAKASLAENLAKEHRNRRNTLTCSSNKYINPVADSTDEENKKDERQPLIKKSLKH